MAGQKEGDQRKWKVFRKRSGPEKTEGLVERKWAIGNGRANSKRNGPKQKIGLVERKWEELEKRKYS